MWYHSAIDDFLTAGPLGGRAARLSAAGNDFVEDAAGYAEVTPA